MYRGGKSIFGWDSDTPASPALGLYELIYNDLSDGLISLPISTGARNHVQKNVQNDSVANNNTCITKTNSKSFFAHSGTVVTKCFEQNFTSLPNAVSVNFFSMSVFRPKAMADGRPKHW